MSCLLISGQIPDEVFFINDKGTGWWNLWKWVGALLLLCVSVVGGMGGDRWQRGGWWQGVGGEEGAEKVLDMAAEFGTPPWVFGSSTFAFVPKSKTQLVCTYK